MMRLSALLLLCFWPLLSPAAPAMQQTTIHHCVASNGTPVFTDKSCSRLDATPVAAPSTVSPDGRSTGANDDTIIREWSHGPQKCPRSLGELESRVAEAFRAHDPNALAALMLWRGYSRRDATRTVRHLAHLTRWPLLGFADTQPDPAQQVAMDSGLPPLIPPDEEPAPTPPRATTLTVKLDSPKQSSASFAIAQRHECLWLQP